MAKKTAQKPTPLLTEVSISQASRDTGFHRQTIRNAIAAAGLKPSREIAGNPRYRYKDLLPVLYQGQTADEVDPDKMKPFDRKAHYQAEREKLNLEVERGQLAPAMDVERGYFWIFDMTAQSFETAVDNAERDVGLSALQSRYLDEHFDRCRSALYKRIVEGPTHADGAAGELA